MLFSSHAVQVSVLLFISTVLGQYSLQDDYTTSSFGSMFDFFTDDDPTNGYVNYVSQSQAESQGLFTTKNNAVYIGVDSTNVASGRGRNSVRISSKNTYTHGLFILDLAHMPGGQCGTWPAFWTLGPDWPTWGEIDIIENVNSAAVNRMSAHTDSSCSITNTGNFTGSILTTNCDSNAPDQSANAGCSFTNTLAQTFGAGFNAIGGGVYATEWTSQAISIWFFPRLLIPSDIVNGSPDPSSWGKPLAQFTGGGCDIDDHFQNHQIVFDVSMCGDWAGEVWSQDAVCSLLASTCQDYVQNNPSAFVDTYWLINSLKVYQANNQQVPSSSLSSSSTAGTTTPATPSATTTTATTSPSTPSSSSVVPTTFETSTVPIIVPPSATSTDTSAAPVSTPTSADISVPVPTSTNTDTSSAPLPESTSATQGWQGWNGAQQGWGPPGNGWGQGNGGRWGGGGRRALS